MKMMYGNTPVKSLNVHHFEMDTNDATLISSDLQAGVTAYARGQKIIGTGKSFEFARYGIVPTNINTYVPTNINIIEVSSSVYPVKLAMDLSLMHTIDFSNEQKIATIIINDSEHDLSVSVQSNIMKISCDESVQLQVFYGKDNYI